MSKCCLLQSCSRNLLCPLLVIILCTFWRQHNWHGQLLKRFAPWSAGFLYSPSLCLRRLSSKNPANILFTVTFLALTISLTLLLMSHTNKTDLNPFVGPLIPGSILAKYLFSVAQPRSGSKNVNLKRLSLTLQPVVSAQKCSRMHQKNVNLKRLSLTVQAVVSAPADGRLPTATWSSRDSSGTSPT